MSYDGYAGSLMFRSRLADRTGSVAGRPTRCRGAEELTPAERDVLRLLGTGLSNSEIADQLYLSAGTVKAHISRILTRTGCANRVQAAVLAHDAGLLTDR